MEDLELRGQTSRAIRGYIMRYLARVSQVAMMVKQIESALAKDGLDAAGLGRHLQYLEERGYVKLSGGGAVVKLTAAGIDIIEGTTADPGVEI